MALFLELATLAEELAGEAGRLKKRALIEIAVGRVAAVSVEDAGRFCLYLAGQPFAEAEPRKLNAGRSAVDAGGEDGVGVLGCCADGGVPAAW